MTVHVSARALKWKMSSDEDQNDEDLVRHFEDGEPLEMGDREMDTYSTSGLPRAFTSSSRQKGMPPSFVSAGTTKNSEPKVKSTASHQPRKGRVILLSFIFTKPMSTMYIID